MVFKELRKLWEKHDPNLPWKKGDYDESNTLLVDDSPYKALLNPVSHRGRFYFILGPFVVLCPVLSSLFWLHLNLQMHTGVFPCSFTYQNKSDNLLGKGLLL